MNGGSLLFYHHHHIIEKYRYRYLNIKRKKRKSLEINIDFLFIRKCLQFKEKENCGQKYVYYNNKYLKKGGREEILRKAKENHNIELH